MRIIGLEGMTPDEVNYELDRGARFVMFDYVVSVVILTFRQRSNIYFVRSDEGTFVRSLGYIMATCLFGWWGIPWGPIFSIGAIATNLGGGSDVTNEVLAMLNEAA